MNQELQDEEKQKLRNKCPKCNHWTWSYGVLGPGTFLEIKCKHCKEKFIVSQQ